MNNYFKVDKKEKTCLFASQSKFAENFKLHDHLVYADTNKNANITWEVEIEKTGLYQLGVCANIYEKNIELTISSGESCVSMNLSKSNGYFHNQNQNFERYLSQENIKLDEGIAIINLKILNPNNIDVTLSFIELYPMEYEDYRLEIIKEAKKAKEGLPNFDKGYGMMVHWTAQSYPRNGQQLSYEDAVNQFDTDKFALMLHEMNVKYLFITMNHGLPHFPAPIKAWDKYYKGMTTERDLVECLYNSLSKYNIDLMLYINLTVAYKRSAFYGDKNIYPQARLEAYQSEKEPYKQIGMEILSEIGERYKEKIKAYWIDASYQLSQQFGCFDFKDFYYATKIGNPKRLVTFNHWILPVCTDWVDYWAGETNNILKYPETQYPEYGPAKGVLFHDLITMEDEWGHFVKDTQIEPPKYTAKELIDYIKACNKVGGMVTVNAKIYQDATISPESFEILKEVGKAFD